MDYVAAIVAALGAVAACVTATAAWHKARQNNSQLQEIHVLVNSRLTEVCDRVGQLTQSLQAAGVEVPPDPSARS